VYVYIYIYIYTQMYTYTHKYIRVTLREGEDGRTNAYYRVFRARFRVRGRSRKSALGVLEELSIGVAAGACSRAFTTPIANVVTRKQTGAMMAEGDKANGKGGGKKEDGEEAHSVRQIVNSIIKERGVTGLWAGYSATLVLTLNPGITFFMQEFLTRSLLGGDDPDDDEDDDLTGPVMTFLLAAVSKAIASAIMYPFQTAKARLQAGVPLSSESAEEGESEAQAVQNGTNGNIHNKDGDSKLSPRHIVKMFAQQSVFWTIAQIARREGVGALYDGMHGDLLKGFFGHGTTMLVKGVMHKLLFKLYLVVAGLLLELRLRRRQALLQSGSAGDGGTLRALSFMNSDAHNKAAETGSSQNPMASGAISRSATSFFTKIPTLISHFTASGNKASHIEGQQHIPSSPSIMNIQDRSHRAFDKD
jgi:hypothetical protein